MIRVYYPEYIKNSQQDKQPNLKMSKGASLVAQWLRIHLPMQETRDPALVQEDPTCRGATKPCATTTEPAL